MVDASRPSKEYELMRARWKRVRDCVEGSDAIKAAGTSYLPALMGHYNGSRLNQEYLDYKTRALFYNAFGRSVDGLNGMVFRRPPITDLPPAAEEFTDNVDLLGRSLDDFADACLREALTTGRVGVLVEHTSAPVEQPVDPADPPRPYLVMYDTESILDVVHATVGGVRFLRQVRLHEVHEEPSETDEFAADVVERVRVLELDEAGNYFQRVFRMEASDEASSKAKVTWLEEEPIFPRLPDGTPMRAIPFFLIGTGVARVPGQIEPPPLLDLADVNLAHYRQDADYRNALHMAGVPTPVFTGIAAPEEGQPPVKLGAMEGIFLPQPNSDAKFLSYGGDGVAAIREALQDLEQQMAFLGARMLAPEKRMVESAETARIHRAGEISVLGRMANIVSNKLSDATRVLLAWADIVTDEKQGIRLNDDFLPTQASPQLIAEVTKAWQAGAISHDSLWLALQEGEIVDPRRSIEEERAIIEEEAKETAEAEKQDLELESQRLNVEQQRIGIEQQRNGGNEQQQAA
jgi:Domain of unknown function (DUF4055)